MHILIAPNAFKHSLGAQEVADAIKAGYCKASSIAVVNAFQLLMAEMARAN
jgi:glycerate kinase